MAWGIGYYENSKPMIVKRGENAFYSDAFEELSAEVVSRIFVAHVRYASIGGSHSDKNAHPFVFQNWIFAHNGTIRSYHELLLRLRKPYN
jgi:glutamine amidotransferase